MEKRKGVDRRNQLVAVIALTDLRICFVSNGVKKALGIEPQSLVNTTARHIFESGEHFSDVMYRCWDGLEKSDSFTCKVNCINSTGDIVQGQLSSMRGVSPEENNVRRAIIVFNI